MRVISRCKIFRYINAIYLYRTACLFEVYERAALSFLRERHVATLRDVTLRRMRWQTLGWPAFSASRHQILADIAVYLNFAEKQRCT